MSLFSLSYVSSLRLLLLLAAAVSLAQTGAADSESVDASPTVGSHTATGQVSGSATSGSSDLSSEAATSFGLAMNDAIKQMDNNITNPNSKWAHHRQRNVNLPSYFSYSLYCRFFGKPLPLADAFNEARHQSYLKRALKVFERRVLWRAGRLDSLASVNELSDLVSTTLLFQHQHRLSQY